MNIIGKGIEDIFLDYQGKDLPEQLLERLGEAKELETEDYKTLEEIISKKARGEQEMFSIEETIYNNYYTNLRRAVQEKLAGLKPLQIIETSKALTDIKKATPEFSRAVVDEEIRKWQNKRLGGNTSPNSFRNLNNKLDDAFNKKTSVEDYYKNRY